MLSTPYLCGNLEPGTLTDLPLCSAATGNVHTYDNVIDYLSAMEWPVRSKIFSDNFFVINNFKLICIERETVNKHVK